MSTFYPHRLQCDCGTSFTVELVRGIHITRLPDARQQILDGEFQVFSCPACAKRTAVDSRTVYTDFDRNQYVAVEPRSADNWPAVKEMHSRIFVESFDGGPAIASEMGVRFTRRCVFGFAALREKLLLWDAGLDDLAVEGVKAALAEAFGLTASGPLYRLEDVLPGGHLTFRVVTDDGEDDFETVPATEYRRFVERRPEITARWPWLADEWVVDAHDGFRLLAQAV